MVRAATRRVGASPNSVVGDYGASPNHAARIPDGEGAPPGPQSLVPNSVAVAERACVGYLSDRGEEGSERQKPIARNATSVVVSAV